MGLVWCDKAAVWGGVVQGGLGGCLSWGFQAWVGPKVDVRGSGGGGGCGRGRKRCIGRRGGSFGEEGEGKEGYEEDGEREED